ncbi:hypothetical protein FHX59_002413 [Paraburkholderia silvatlantica]|uniref:Uncharacterized protein n=1 Tax=Paraburkholderia silvatlantica TaxID=321895 RepID=A0ABR6FLM0_9BURK|nr:hypothetical protein [Paraburkholderia silvatlantica]PVY17635.1 hypothetical protein C7411_14818 [Paraburkholderia silvatlantica]PXW23547.1 hypothetical protein C7413_15218 [Paraburkholderia silvatlantica]
MIADVTMKVPAVGWTRMCTPAQIVNDHSIGWRVTAYTP